MYKYFLTFIQLLLLKKICCCSINYLFTEINNVNVKNKKEEIKKNKKLSPYNNNINSFIVNDNDNNIDNNFNENNKNESSNIVEPEYAKSQFYVIKNNKENNFDLRGHFINNNKY